MSKVNIKTWNGNNLTFVNSNKHSENICIKYVQIEGLSLFFYVLFILF